MSSWSSVSGQGVETQGGCSADKGWNQGFICGPSYPSTCLFLLLVPPWCAESGCGSCLRPGSLACVRSVLLTGEQGSSQLSIGLGACPWRKRPNPGRLCRALQHKCLDMVQNLRSQQHLLQTPYSSLQVISLLLGEAQLQEVPETVVRVPGNVPSFSSPPRCSQ